jgi:hypothetical protein
VRGSIVLSFANVLSFARYCTLHIHYKYNQDFLELAGLRIGGDWNVDRTTAEILPCCALTKKMRMRMRMRMRMWTTMRMRMKGT